MSNDGGITLYGFAEFERKVMNTIENYEKKKKVLLTRLGRIYQAEVKKLAPVDTGRLRASIVVEPVDKDTVMVGTNVEYAKFVNDGHQQHRRFLPARIVGGKKGRRLVYDANSPTGVMLREKYIKGKKFFEKGLYAAKPRIVVEIEHFMEELRREFEGGT